MVDDISVVSQSHELQKIAHEVLVEGMVIYEQFRVSAIIDKLPPAWKKYKNTLRHKTKEFSMESLITSLRIEEEHRKQDQKEEILVVSYHKNKSSASLKPTRKPMKIVQNRNPNNQVLDRNRNQNQNKNKYQTPTNTPNNVFECYNCWKPEHRARISRNPTRPRSEGKTPPTRANLVEEPFVATISEMSMVSQSGGCFVNTGNNHHCCFDRSLFSKYTELDDKKVLLG